MLFFLLWLLLFAFSLIREFSIPVFRWDAILTFQMLVKALEQSENTEATIIMLYTVLPCYLVTYVKYFINRFFQRNAGNRQNGNHNKVKMYFQKKWMRPLQNGAIIEQTKPLKMSSTKLLNFIQRINLYMHNAHDPFARRTSAIHKSVYRLYAMFHLSSPLVYRL